MESWLKSTCTIAKAGTGAHPIGTAWPTWFPFGLPPPLRTLESSRRMYTSSKFCHGNIEHCLWPRTVNVEHSCDDALASAEKSVNVRNGRCSLQTVHGSEPQPLVRIAGKVGHRESLSLRDDLFALQSPCFAHGALPTVLSSLG